MVDVAVPSGKSPRLIGRYALFDEVAAGGMATVHIGRLVGPVGFSRTVAIKRLHPQFAKDPEFVTGFLDEARLAARIRHPNVVPTLDVVASHGELFLVMEYVLGESFATLLRASRDAGERPPQDVVCAIVSGTLHGLHAAHEAKSERGEPLGIVHRDVSPQNILVGVDGVPRVLDFGIAKAAGRAQVTRDGQVKGKMAYVAPEQFQLGAVNRKVDIYAAAVVLWEALTGERLFRGESEGATIAKVLTGEVQRPSAFDATISTELDELVLRGLSRDPADRFDTARDMARALESCIPLAPPSRVGEWVERTAGSSLVRRSQAISQVEQIADLPADEVRLAVLPSHREEPTAIVEVGDITAADGVEAPDSTADTVPLIEAHVLPKRRQRRGALVALSAVSLFLLAIWVGVWVREAKRSRAEAAAQSPHGEAPTLSLPAETAPVEDAPSGSDAPAPSAAVADSAPEPAPSQPAAPEAAPEPESRRRAAPRSASSATRERAGVSARKAAKSRCNPPYTVDEAGHRHYKVECL